MNTVLVIAAIFLCVIVPARAQYDIYRANLHVHTDVSKNGLDHAGAESPSITVTTAQSFGLDIVGLSDHAGAISDTEWGSLKSCADAHQNTGTVALRGFEWTYCGQNGFGDSSDYEHVNVFGTTNRTEANNSIPTSQALSNLNTWLGTVTMDDDGYGWTPVAQFNHIWMGTHFLSFAGGPPNQELDTVFCLAEIGGEGWNPLNAEELADYIPQYHQAYKSESYFQMALQQGWHVAPTIGRDNFGALDIKARKNNTAILAESCTRWSLMDALRHRRVFASEDANFELKFQARTSDENTWHWMGEVITVAPDENIDFRVVAKDCGETIDSVTLIPASDGIGYIFAYENNPDDFNYTLSLSHHTLDSTTKTNNEEWCFYVRVIESDGDYIYSAPIWLKLGLHTVADPEFDNTGGIYGASQFVKVTCSTSGAIIHYTTNGETPTESDPVVNSGSTVPVDHEMWLKAKAFRTGWNPSDVTQSWFDIRRCISGRVATPGGEPAIAWVQATPGDDPNTYTWTDVDGSYSLLVPIGWIGSVTVSKDGYAMDPEQHDYLGVVADQTQQNFTALPLKTISGCVRAGNGVGVQDVDIEVFYCGNTHWAYTDANGYYEIGVPLGWSGNVSASKWNYMIDPEMHSYLNVPSDIANQDFVAIPLESISGHVRTSEGGLDGVTVSVIYQGREYTNYTDADGYYQISVPEGWSGDVQAVKSNYEMIPNIHSYTNLQANTTDQDFAAVEFPIISGRVVASDGSPVSGLQVYLSGEVGYTCADENGNYSSRVPYGWTGTINANSEQYTFQPAELLYNYVTDDIGGADFVAIRKLTISGTLREPDGTAVNGVRVIASGSASDSCYSSYDGDYELHVPVDWNGRVYVQDASYTTDPAEHSYEDLEADISGWDFTLTPVTRLMHCISGAVETETGFGVSGLFVYASSQWSTYDNCYTDEFGHYSLEVPDGWSGQVSVSSAGYCFDPPSKSFSNVVSDQDGQNFAASLGVVISGYVRTPDSNQTGLSNIYVETSDGQYACTDANGLYRLRVPKSWTGNVRPYSSYYNYWPISHTYVDQTSDVSDADFTAIAYPRIAGYVRKQNGSGLSGVSVNASDGGSWCETDASGYYSVRVPPGWSGSVNPSVTYHQLTPESHSYTHVVGDMSGEDFDAVAYPAIMGYVYKPNGSGLSNATLTMDDGSSYATDFRGFYAVRVPPYWGGSISVTAWPYSFNPSERSYDYVPSDINHQDYQAISYPVISGRLRKEDGSPISNISVYARSGMSTTSETKTDATGYYTISVPPGWSGDICPSTWDQPYTFSPESRSLVAVTSDVPEQDFLAVHGKTISGYVRREDGSGISGVYIDAYQWSFSHDETDENGYYSIMVPNGWSGAVYTGAWDVSCVCKPHSRSYTNIAADLTDEDYLAVQGVYISGHILSSDGTPVNNLCVMAVDGDNPDGFCDYWTWGSGHYELLVPIGWTGEVTTNWGDYLTPTSRAYENVEGNIAEQDFICTALQTVSGYVLEIDGTADYFAHLVSSDGLVDVRPSSPDGYYTFQVPRGWSGDVAVSDENEPGAFFDPPMRTYSNLTVDLLDQDYQKTSGPTILGRVLDTNGAGIEGIEVHSEEGLVWSSTDSSGYYSAQVPLGWSGEITVCDWSDYGALFNPSKRTYQNVTSCLSNEDYHKIPCFRISGVVNAPSGTLDGYTKISGSNGVGEAIPDYDGSYVLGVPVGWTGTVAVESPFYVFTPVSRTYSNVQSDVSDQDYNAQVTGRRIAEVKQCADGEEVTSLPAVVSAVFQESFYIESEGRECGIKVSCPDFYAMPGDNLAIHGILKTDSNGERYLDLGLGMSESPDALWKALRYCGIGNVAPLCVTNRTLGGGDFFWNGSAGAGQCGVTGGFGLNNIGLLIKACGKYRYVDQHTFTLDDGSGVNVKCVVPDGVSLNPNWNYVGVIGISSCGKIGEERRRVILVRDQNDITPYQ